MAAAAVTVVAAAAVAVAAAVDIGVKVYSGTVRVGPVDLDRPTPAALGEIIGHGGLFMMRDIDYAATAVKTAIVEKFGREEAMDDLVLVANDRTISVQHGDRMAEGTRDHLIGAVRKVGSYDEFWKLASLAPRN
jgi:hypothetical protein